MQQVGVNNSYSKSFEETAEDPQGVMESEGLVTVSNYQTEQPSKEQAAQYSTVLVHLNI